VHLHLLPFICCRDDGLWNYVPVFIGADRYSLWCLGIYAKNLGYRNCDKTECSLLEFRCFWKMDIYNEMYNVRKRNTFIGQTQFLRMAVLRDILCVCCKKNVE